MSLKIAIATHENTRIEKSGERLDDKIFNSLESLCAGSLDSLKLEFSKVADHIKINDCNDSLELSYRNQSIEDLL